MVGPELAESDAPLSRNLIRPPPVDDVNNLRHDGKSRRCLASTAIQIRQNALFTSPEYASRILLLSALSTAMKPPAVADQVQPDQGLAVEEDADAYAIYSALLLTEPLRVTVWNVRNQTERGPLPVCVTPPADQEQIYRPAIEQFAIRNQEKLSLKSSFDLPATISSTPISVVLGAVSFCILPTRYARSPFPARIISFRTSKCQPLASTMSAQERSYTWGIIAEAGVGEDLIT
jgi:hypothetical protein